MTRNDLIKSPYYDQLMTLAREYGIDEDLMRECAVGVVARLQIMIENGTQPELQHVVLCMEHWFKERQKLQQRYMTDATFRARFHKEVHDQLKDDSAWLQQN